MPWAGRVSSLLPRMTALRHRIHRAPEIAHEERQTAAAVAAWICDNTAGGLLPLAEDVGGTGLLFRVQGEGGRNTRQPVGSPGAGATVPSVLLRADLDGLPLFEKSGVPYASETPGRHHACGHDGHSSMLAAALTLLHMHRDEWGGVVYGLFQPAEETGTGALAVLADSAAMATLQQAGGVGRAFSFHNIPQRPLGQVMVRSAGTVARASTGLRVTLRGVQSHAAMPWEGNNPTLALASLASLAAGLPRRHAATAKSRGEEPPLCTLVHLNVGTRDYGISPGVGDLGVTLRACRTTTVDTMAAEIETAAQAVAQSQGLQYEAERIDYFCAAINDAASTAIVLDAATRVSRVPAVEMMQQPFSWSEDFGALASRWGGALVGIGGGLQLPVLHHETYDFPDELTPIGTELWVQVALCATGNYAGDAARWAAQTTQELGAGPAIS